MEWVKAEFLIALKYRDGDRQIKEWEETVMLTTARETHRTPALSS